MNCLMFLHALTPLHPGSGTALGVVDMPVQRERHTHWPTIPGSSLKGVLRDACRAAEGQEPSDDDTEVVQILFGPESTASDNGSSYAGALSITDARILAFPVRSLKGVFAWVTCPAVLQRLLRDARLAGVNNLPDVITAVADDKAFAHSTSSLLLEGTTVALEEFEYTKEKQNVDPLLEWLCEHAFADESLADAVQQWVILSDDNFTHFVSHATEVSARIRLNKQSKTVDKGALFYEEFLPAETVFYSVVIAEASHSQEAMTAPEVFEAFQNSLSFHRDFLQVGGDATIGKGWCAVKLSQEAAV